MDMVWWMTLGLVLSILSLLMYGSSLFGPASSAAYFGLVVPMHWVAVILSLLWLSSAYAFYRNTSWLIPLFSVTLGLELVLLVGSIFSHDQNVQLMTDFFRDHPQMTGGLPPEAFVESSLIMAYLISAAVLAAGLAVLHFLLKDKQPVKNQ